MPEPSFENLPSLARDAPWADLPRLRGLLTEADATVLARLSAGQPQHDAGATTDPATQSAADSPSPLCFTIAQAARLLAVSADYLGRLARQGKILTVRLPALDRGKGANKRTPGEKLVRIPVEALRNMVAAQGVNNALDTTYSTVLYNRNEGARGVQGQKATRSHAVRSRRSRRRPLDHGESLGTRPSEHPGACGEATSPAGSLAPD